ncbi:hypothetical protein [Caulobacter segnis]
MAPDKMQALEAAMAKATAPCAKAEKVQSSRPLMMGAQAQVDRLAASSATAKPFPLSFTRMDGTVVECGYGYVFGDAQDCASAQLMAAE